ncbi:pentatricopeptide repeat-containing protein At1g26900, mitochondrial [Arachis duranensis]|uniref:Pentatricopeptide repeat-containing protein At1g26900, mitochondrial n=1 Tax=Arachis duranensis TaxID=130453 RepID=A0A6P5NN59_ARADU|nr:pentatricopeptide repeat-containing protein At1g26900, mitochondrial [Arachis duranensis]
MKEGVPVLHLHHKVALLLELSCKTQSHISQIHAFMLKTALINLPFPLSKLLAASISHIHYAASIFNSAPNPNLFMFNTMLRGYSISNSPAKALPLFNQLRNRPILIDRFSFITVIKACARLSNLIFGRGLHGLALRSGTLLFLDFRNTLLHFYCVSRRLGDADNLFDEFPQRNDLVSWNTLMAGHLLASQPELTFHLFRKMRCCGVEASVATALSLLSAAADMQSFLGGKCLHGYYIRLGLSSNLNVLTALIDLYARMGRIFLAHRVFDGVAQKDVILWNCLIGKYARSGLLGEAVKLLQQMSLEGFKPNSSTLVGLLSGCPASGSVQVVRYVTSFMVEEKLEVDAVLGTALVNAYAKCGFLDEATDIFERMKGKDMKTWTAMISGHGIHGQPTNAVKLFNRMENEGFRPNEVTFLAVLSACSHGGLVIEGMEIFKSMVCKYGFSPQVEHYGSLIDLLGRAGMLHEAHKLIESLPIKGDATAWRTLLSACRVYGDVKLGECVKDVLSSIYTEHPTDSLLISGIYVASGRISDLIRLQELKQTNAVTVETDGGNMLKEAGVSIVEIDNQG